MSRQNKKSSREADQDGSPGRGCRLRMNSVYQNTASLSRQKIQAQGLSQDQFNAHFPDTRFVFLGQIGV